MNQTLQNILNSAEDAWNELPDTVKVGVVCLLLGVVLGVVFS